MTATERLRSMLDARGIEHKDTDILTIWLNSDEVECTAMESPVMDGRLCVALTCTPLEAVQATTGGELERRLERIERRLNHKGAGA